MGSIFLVAKTKEILHEYANFRFNLSIILYTEKTHLYIIPCKLEITEILPTLPAWS